MLTNPKLIFPFQSGRIQKKLAQIWASAEWGKDPMIWDLRFTIYDPKARSRVNRKSQIGPDFRAGATAHASGFPVNIRPLFPSNLELKVALPILAVMVGAVLAGQSCFSQTVGPMKGPQKPAKPSPAIIASTDASLPLPGIYETAPFTGIVLVPGPQPDDRALRKVPAVPGIKPAMPIFKPELRLIPRSPKK